jgi:hypothetical protein
VPPDQIAHQVDIFRQLERLEIDHFRVAAGAERAGHVEHVGDAA